MAHKRLAAHFPGINDRPAVDHKITQVYLPKGKTTVRTEQEYWEFLSRRVQKMLDRTADPVEEAREINRILGYRSLVDPDKLTPANKRRLGKILVEENHELRNHLEMTGRVQMVLLPLKGYPVDEDSDDSAEEWAATIADPT